MKNASRRNGTLRAPQLLKTASKLALPLSLLLLASPLAGCVTDQTGTTVTDTETQCVAWRAIHYSGTKDTALTVQQIRVHNATGTALGCWRK